MVKRNWIAGLCVAAALSLGAQAAAGGDDPTELLRKYVAAEDESFKYELAKEEDVGVGTAYVLHLTSQTWRGHDWKHWVTMLVPNELRHEDGAVLIVEGGRNRPTPPTLNLDMAFQLIATQLKMPVVLLQQVPNQPMFGNLREDALIAMTFDRFIREGDEDWPLLLPMTKSAVRAMDAVQQFLAEKRDMKVERFVVGGGSKRGWTTYLAGAVDGRVKGMVPSVIDMLNLAPQMRRQLKSYGRYSEMIRDYSNLNVIERIYTDEGARLAAVVDPYSYRESLTMPKLVILGTNDPYWTVDAANLYFPDLPDPKHLHYGPNAGHDIQLPSLPTLIRFIHNVFDRRPMPDLRWERNDDGSLTVRWDAEKAEPQLMTARMPSRDFRQARWQARPLETNGNSVRVSMNAPEEGYLAYFVQVSFPGETVGALPIPPALSTTITVLPDTFPFTAEGEKRNGE